jgi:hypothetical protein
MESTGSCSLATATTFPTSSRIPSSASKKKAQEIMRVQGAFKCKLCRRAFPTARSRAGHQTAHRRHRAPVKNQKARRSRRPAWSPAIILPSSCYSYATALRTACLRAQPFSDWSSHYDPSVRPAPPSFPWQTSTGGVAPAQVLATAARYPRPADMGNLGREQGLREENQDETANGIDLTLRL